MRGVILCGGKSSRMGADKGMLMMQSASWAQAAASKMDALGLPVSVSVNDAQYLHYAQSFEPSQLVKDNMSIDVKGPLLGILSVHLQFPLDDLFVLACDMPLMQVELMQTLLAQYEKERADAFVFANDNYYEPLCGIYTANGLSALTQRYKSKELRQHSMQFALTCLHPSTLTIMPHQQHFFLNVNNPSELSGL